MTGGAIVSASNNPAILELEGALARIGVTNAHKQIIVLILVGCLFDAFEQNTIGIVGPALRSIWGLNSTDMSFLNTVTFGIAAIGRLLSDSISDHYGRRVMLGINLILFTIDRGHHAVRVLLAKIPRYGCRTRQCKGRGFRQLPGTRVRTPHLTLFSGPENWRCLFASLALPCLLVVFYRRLMALPAAGAPGFA